MDAWTVGKWAGSGDARHLRVRGIEVDGTTQGHVFVEVGTALGLGETMGFTGLAHASQENGNRTDCNVAARWIAGRFRSNSASNDVTWELMGYRYDAFPVGRR